jgi:hypothetical protein
VIWWSSNLLLATAFVATLYCRVREYPVRRYLDGFSDAIRPNTLPAEQKVEAIWNWMRALPSRAIATNQYALAKRDPEMTFIYRPLLNVCGTATNGFSNLARSSELQVRRLLRWSPARGTKQVVAEVLTDERSIIVDPSYRVIMKDTRGHNLTLSDLRDPAVFSEAAGAISNHPLEYPYDQFAHLRLARLPERLHLRRLLDGIYSGWDESTDGTLFLERGSFYFLVLCGAATFFFLPLRALLAWYADSHLRKPLFHLLTNPIRAGAVFFSAPETKQ